MIYPPTLGVLLAGGLSRRMGGPDKALSLLAGRPLLTHCQDRLEPQCNSLILNANGNAARFKHFTLPVVIDGVAGYPGPLAGILAALDWAAEHRPDIPFVVSVAVDTPFLPSDYVAHLYKARALAGTVLSCAASGGRRHPVNGLWPVALRGTLRSAIIEDGIRRVQDFSKLIGVTEADWPVAPFDPFFNVNTLQDLVEAERCYAKRS